MRPVSGTYEWAKYSINCVLGCQSDCKFCYAKATAIRYGKKNIDTWKIEEIDDKAVNKEYKKYDGIVMFPTSHDISEYTLSSCLIVLKKLLVADNKVLIVSKPHLSCIIKLCEDLKDYKNNILFRFTIGSADNSVLKFWEHNTTTFEERIKSLMFAYEDGFQTSISCEPMLDGNIQRVVEITLPYVTDAIWLGKMNFATSRLANNGEFDAIDKAGELMEIQSDKFIMDLYKEYKDNPKIKWKDSIKKIVGLERSFERGLDK